MTAAALEQTGTGQPALRLVPRPPVTADSDAMREVWQRHGAVLMKFALRLTRGDTQRAEDIVQETLVRAWRHPEVVGSGQQPIRSWLFTITRNVAIDMWRARARRDESLKDEHADLPDPAEPIENVVTAVDVRAALGKLIPVHRQVIVEVYLRDRSVAEVADMLGIPEGTVKSRAYYGLRRLRQVLSAASGDPQPTEAQPTQITLPA